MSHAGLRHASSRGTGEGMGGGLEWEAQGYEQSSEGARLRDAGCGQGCLQEILSCRPPPGMIRLRTPRRCPAYRAIQLRTSPDIDARYVICGNTICPVLSLQPPELADCAQWAASAMRGRGQWIASRLVLAVLAILASVQVSRCAYQFRKIAVDVIAQPSVLML